MSDNEVKAEVLAVFDAGVALRPVMNVASAMQQLAEFQQFVKEYLVADEDYGTIPGTPKPTLYKSGAEKLCDIYGIADDYIKTKETENWETVPPLFDYEFKCVLTSRRDQRFLGSGYGSCNSHESKYKWRDSKRKCPLCGKEAIIKGQEKYGGGWICWKKRDGCGSKFLDDDKAIAEQASGRSPNEDIADIKNTILKMAKKRAKIDAVIAVTRSSGIFSQDMEDRPEADSDNGQGTHSAAQRVAEEKIKATDAKKAKKTASEAPNSGNGPINADRSLFHIHHSASDTWEITGARELMSAHRELLKPFWSPTAEAVVVNATQLDTLKHELESRKVPFLPLKENTHAA